MTSKESVVKGQLPNVPPPSIKILPPQIARLKKEQEEEETWISGEELYTEGSSDEESCRGKSDSTLSMQALAHHRPRSKADKKKKAAAASEAHHHDRNTLSARSEGPSSSASRGRASSVSDEDEEYRADDEISWKANRDEFLLEDEIVALEEHRREYPKICDRIDKLFENYSEKLNNLEKADSEHFLRQNERLQEEIKSSLSFVDTIIDEMQVKLEKVQKTTKRIQMQNRLRLKKIIAEGPPESKKLAESSKKFFELMQSDSEVEKSM